jgi:hypothetical protein
LQRKSGQRFASLDIKQRPTYLLYERDWDGNEKRYNLKPFEIPRNIPSSNTEKFIGRARELEHLHQQLQRNDEVAITAVESTAVEGMAGVGKTELAIQYSLLHLQLHTYPGGICWLRAREEDIGLQIIEFARINFGLAAARRFGVTRTSTLVLAALAPRKHACGCG